MLNTILANKIPEKIQKSIKFWIDLLVFLVSVVLIGTAVVDYGFVLDETETLYKTHCTDDTSRKSLARLRQPHPHRRG